MTTLDLEGQYDQFLIGLRDPATPPAPRAVVEPL
jgi:hypothetical protein